MLKASKVNKMRIWVFFQKIPRFSDYHNTIKWVYLTV